MVDTYKGFDGVHEVPLDHDDLTILLRAISIALRTALWTKEEAAAVEELYERLKEFLP